MYPATEADWTYSGFLSHRGEIHAFMQGVGVGIGMTTPGRVGFDLKEAFTTEHGLAEASRESWYFAGGILTGIALGVATRRYRETDRTYSDTDTSGGG